MKNYELHTNYGTASFESLNDLFSCLGLLEMENPADYTTLERSDISRLLHERSYYENSTGLISIIASES